MEKRKCKQENFFFYLVDEFILFRRDFCLEVDARPELVANSLQTLPPKPWEAHKTKIHTEVDILLEKSIKFRIFVGDIDKPKAVAVGTISPIEDGMSLIEGKATVGGLAAWALILPMIVISIVSSAMRGTIPTPSPDTFLQFVWTMIISPVVSIVLWFSMYFDRNYLLVLIQEVAELAEQSNKTESVSEADTLSQAVSQAGTNHEQIQA
jgi:hypothetical protein